MQKGFTLIELMVTLVVLIVLLGLGIPNFTEWVKKTRIETGTRSLTGALMEARSEAVSRQTVITLAPADGGWAAGLSMYTDADTGGNSAYSASDDTMIKELNFSMGGVTVDTVSNADEFISFNSNGQLNESGSTVEMALCDDRGEEAGALITINLVGRTNSRPGTINNPLTTCTP